MYKYDLNTDTDKDTVRLGDLAENTGKDVTVIMGIIARYKEQFEGKLDNPGSPNGPEDLVLKKDAANEVIDIISKEDADKNPAPKTKKTKEPKEETAMEQTTESVATETTPVSDTQPDVAAAFSKDSKEPTEKKTRRKTASGKLNKASLNEMLGNAEIAGKNLRKMLIATGAKTLEEVALMTDEEVDKVANGKFAVISIGGNSIVVDKKALLGIVDSMAVL